MTRARGSSTGASIGTTQTSSFSTSTTTNSTSTSLGPSQIVGGGGGDQSFEKRTRSLWN